VPALADWCTVRLAADDGVMRLAAAVHRDPSKASRVSRLRASHVSKAPYGSAPVRSPRLYSDARGRLCETITDALLGLCGSQW
jgi:hypothetical protein